MPLKSSIRSASSIAVVFKEIKSMRSSTLPSARSAISTIFSALSLSLYPINITAEAGAANAIRDAKMITIAVRLVFII